MERVHDSQLKLSLFRELREFDWSLVARHRLDCVRKSISSDRVAFDRPIGSKDSLIPIGRSNVTSPDESEFSNSILGIFEFENCARCRLPEATTLAIWHVVRMIGRNRKPGESLVVASPGIGHMCLAGLAYRSSTERALPKMRRVYVIRGNAMPRRYW